MTNHSLTRTLAKRWKGLWVLLPLVSGLIVFPRTNVLPFARGSSNEATKSAKTSAHSSSSFCKKRDMKDLRINNLKWRINWHPLKFCYLLLFFDILFYFRGLLQRCIHHSHRESLQLVFWDRLQHIKCTSDNIGICTKDISERPNYIIRTWSNNLHRSRL